MILELGNKWVLGSRIGSGGFGKVYEALSEDKKKKVAIKLIPKANGASRDLLFIDLARTENVIPILDSGESEDHWIIVMELADYSLRDHLDSNPDSREQLAIDVLKDVTDSLASLENNIVHRDIKPENILYYDDKWCLSDFGISRYAEATTAPDTQKYALSPPYAAPERWRSERASSKTDIYSLGVVGYEIIEGHLPFIGPTIEDYREQHLNLRPERPHSSSSALPDLIEETLYKSFDARPNTANLKARLESVIEVPAIRIEALEFANTTEISRRSGEDLEKIAARETLDRRSQLQSDATVALERISNGLKNAISSSAPTAEFAGGSSARSWFVKMNNASLEFPPITYVTYLDWGGWSEPPVFDVIATAEIILKASKASYGRLGRAHSLWYCDAVEQGVYKWFETGFMISTLIPKSTVYEPYSLDPGNDAAKALWPGMAEFQVAWPFTPLEEENLTDFIVRWGTWFADTAQNGYQLPSQMPEKPTQGTWRRS